MKNFSINKLPKDYLFEISEKTVKIRKQKKISQQQLAKMSGVSYGSIKRFEQTGQIAFEAFLMLLFSLGRISDLDAILETKTDIKSIEKLFDI